jgi:hypothetical protein
VQSWVGAPALPDGLPGPVVFGRGQHPGKQPYTLFPAAAPDALLTLPTFLHQPRQMMPIPANNIPRPPSMADSYGVTKN